MVDQTSAPVVRIVLSPACKLFLPCAQKAIVRGVARATAMARASASTILDLDLVILTVSSSKAPILGQNLPSDKHIKYFLHAQNSAKRFHWIF